MDFDSSNPAHQQILMRFLVDRLAEPDAAELEALLDDPQGAMAADAALRRLPSAQRAPLLALDAATRRQALDGLAKARRGDVTPDPDADKSFNQRFPNAGRLA